MFLAASEPAGALPSLGARAMDLRELFTADATVLAKRNLVDGKKLAELKGGNGYLNVAYDISVLVAMLRERWSELKGKSAIQPADLDQADQLSVGITRAYAERIEDSDHVATVSDERVRAYTLLIDAYSQARRAITYLRWDDGDIDKVAPSLWSGRGGRGSAAKAVQPSGASNGAATPSNANGTSPVVVAAPAAPAAPVEPGLPGGSPLMH